MDDSRPLLELFPPRAPQLAVGPRAPSVPARDEAQDDSPERPFAPAASDLKFLYRSAEHDRAAEIVIAAISRREGIIVLTGPQGIGKTMLCRAVLEQLDAHSLAALITEPFGSTEELLKRVLVDFGVISAADLAAGPLAGATGEALSATLRDFLRSLAPLQAFAVLIIDDADRRPVDVLRDVDALSEEDGDERLLLVVFSGRPSLLRALRRWRLRPLARRAAVRCALGPLSADEVAGYVAHRLTVVSTGPRVEFDAGAIARLYRMSRGVPGTVNAICDRALLTAKEESKGIIDRRAITEACRDLRLRPPISALGRVALAAMMVGLLALAGAAVAAYVLGAEVSAAALVWQEIPPTPAPPARAVAPALPRVVPTS